MNTFQVVDNSDGQELGLVKTNATEAEIRQALNDLHDFIDEASDRGYNAETVVLRLQEAGYEAEVVQFETVYF